jgi:hypothetical protein
MRIPPPPPPFPPPDSYEHSAPPPPPPSSMHFTPHSGIPMNPSFPPPGHAETPYGPPGRFASQSSMPPPMPGHLSPPRSGEGASSSSSVGGKRTSGTRSRASSRVKSKRAESSAYPSSLSHEGSKSSRKQAKNKSSKTGRPKGEELDSLRKHEVRRTKDRKKRGGNKAKQEKQKRPRVRLEYSSSSNEGSSDLSSASSMDPLASFLGSKVLRSFALNIALQIPFVKRALPAGAVRWMRKTAGKADDRHKDGGHSSRKKRDDLKAKRQRQDTQIGKEAQVGKVGGKSSSDCRPCSPACLKASPATNRCSHSRVSRLCWVGSCS